MFGHLGSKGYYSEIRTRFLSLKWNEIYDFIEFLLPHLSQPLSSKLVEHLNRIFEEENIPYRIIGNTVTDISDPIEMESVDNAIDSPYSNSAQHIQTALGLLYGDKPDYRNSIKESISAIESAAKTFTGKHKATLSELLKKLDPGTMHQAFKDSLTKLYAYTSDGDGIRHALMEESNLTHAEAKFFLIQCSAFVNFIAERHSKTKN